MANVIEIRGRAAMKFTATRPTMIITTRHASGVLNAGVFGAWTNLSGEHVGVAVSTGSHTYANIRREGEFTINIPGADLVPVLATIAEAVPPDRSEVDEAGLTPRDPVAIDTPGIAECQAAVEFRLDREVAIGPHSLLIGVCAGGWIREDVRDPDGRINVFKARIVKDYRYPEPLYFVPGDVIRG